MSRGQVIPFSPHVCPHCGRPMRLVSSVPRFGSFPELHTYGCRACGVAYTESAERDGKAPDKPEL